MAGGRPTDYNPKYCEEIIEFFDKEPWEETENGRVPCKLPTLARFAVDRGVCRETVWNWSQTHPEFFNAIKRAKAIQEDLLVQNGLTALYDKTLSIFCLKNLSDWKDKKEVEHSGEGISLSITNNDSAL